MINRDSNIAANQEYVWLEDMPYDEIAANPAFPAALELIDATISREALQPSRVPAPRELADPVLLIDGQTGRPESRQQGWPG